MNKELLDIIEYLESPEAPWTVLATVVDVEGSSYRLPGARMLIAPDGRTIGTVSGGCLEADLIERAKRVLRTAEAEVITYDTRTSDDSVFSLNMGCKGAIRILLELPREELIGFLKHRWQTDKPGVAATLISVKNAQREERVGARLLLDGRGIVFKDLSDATLDALLPHCHAVLRERKSKLLATPIGEAFLEYVSAPTHLVIFGAGSDAVSLAELAKGVGWRVTVVDHRPALITRERFQTADETLQSRPEELSARLRIGGNVAAVVMTHSYTHDREILKFLLGSEAFYIGSLGPKKRAEKILSELARGGAEVDGLLSAENLERLHAPIGLDIGADTPELIAISIIAEIQSVLRNRRGGFLRERTGPIHERNGHAAPLIHEPELAPRGEQVLSLRA